MVNTENQVIFIKNKKYDEIFAIVKKVLKIILGANTVKLHYYSNILSIVKCKLYDPDSFLYDE